MITDPIGDLITRIRNAVMAGNSQVVAPYSRLKQAVADVLVREGYLLDAKKVKYDLVINLALKRRKPVITGIKNISRPGLRIYRGAAKLPRPLQGAGVSIISTSKGVLSNKEAFKAGLGGEVLGEVW